MLAHRFFGVLAIVCAAAITSSARADQGPGKPMAAGEGGRIVPDPAVRLGVLSNGLRYAIMTNTTPAHAISLRLAVRVGAFDEASDERGGAHFLEHMAFSKGQRWDASGDEAAFAALGVAFGRDQNAATGRFSTSYRLDMPNTEPSSLDKAFHWLRGVASQTVFTPEIVERERQIVLRELSERTSDQSLIAQQINGFMAPGLRSEQNDVGGTAASVQAISAETLKRLYDRWYRPDNAVLVVVGDASADDIEQKIRQVFGDWAATGPLPQRPPYVSPDTHRAEDSLTIANAHTASSLNICRLTANLGPQPDDMARYRYRLLSTLWTNILNERLSELGRAGDPPFLGAKAAHSFGREAERTCVTALTIHEDWSGAEAVIRQQLDRMKTTAPSEDELEHAVTVLRAHARGDLHGAASRNASDLATEIMNDQLEGDVFPSPYEAFRSFDAAAADVTPADVKAAFDRDWNGAGPLLTFVSPGPPTADLLRQAWEHPPTRADATQPVKQTPWPYNNFGPAGHVVSREPHTGPDFVRLTFSNGVVLDFKQTKFKDNEVQVRVRIGAGRAELAKSDLVTAQFGTIFLPSGGLGLLDQADIQRTFASSAASVQMSLSATSFFLAGRTNERGLSGQLELMAAFLTDPGFRGDVDNRLAAAVDVIYRQVHANPALVLSDALERAIAPDDPLAMPAKEALLANTRMADFSRVLKPVLTQAPFEIAIVGDVDEATATELAAQTLGALPARAQTDRRRPDAWFAHYSEAELPTVHATHDGEADKAVVGAVWPLYVADPARRREEVALIVMTRVLSDALRHRLREDLGLTYGPSVAMSSPDHGDQATIEAAVETSPADVEMVGREIQATAAKLASGQITDADVEAARKPMVAETEAAMATNIWWSRELVAAPQLQDSLDEINQTSALLSSVTPDEIRQAARSWLTRKPLVVVVTPAGAPAPSK